MTSTLRKIVTHLRGSFFQAPRSLYPVSHSIFSAKVASYFLGSLSLALVFSSAAQAEWVSQAVTEITIPSQANESAAPQEVDASLSREYEPAIVYLPDPKTHRLVARSVLVAADQPVSSAVGQIIQAYQGQEMGIRGYDVKVNPATHEAQINFDLDNSQGAKAFRSLSSANQYALFEAIRETLLTQSTYQIDQITFTADRSPFDI